MKGFLRKIKLIDHFTTELEIDKNTFVDRLSAITDEGSTGLFSNPFDIFTSNKKTFKGRVTLDDFILKKQMKAFDAGDSMCSVKGTLAENDGKLTIEAEVNGVDNFIAIFYILLMSIATIFIVIALLSKETPSFLLPLVFFQGIIWYSLPYLFLKRRVERMKYDLEREFFYLTKNG
jgi:hypothetical protein